jgi:penicillin-binding protein 1A
VPSIALGVEEVSPLDLASAFHTFANDGTRVQPYAISRIEDGDGNVLWEPDLPEPEEGAVDPDISRAVTEALRGVIESGTGEAANIGRPAAGKTGTTQNNIDAWFAGYVPGYTVVTWVGFPEPTEMPGVTGGRFPAQIWQRFMAAAMEGREPEDFSKPPDDLLRPKESTTTSSSSTSSSSTSTTEADGSTDAPTTTVTLPGNGNTTTTQPPTTTTSPPEAADAQPADP